MIVVIRNSVGMFMLPEGHGMTSARAVFKMLIYEKTSGGVGWKVTGTKSDNVMLPIELLLQSSFTIEPERNRGNFYPHVLT